MLAKKSLLLSLIIAIFIPGPAKLMAATQAEIDEAIERGIEWLVAQQGGNGSWGNCPSRTGFAVIKLEDRAIELGFDPFDPCYPYKSAVEAGLNFIFLNASVVSISTEPAGDPDSDGDGNGVCIGGHSTYHTGICMMAIAASRAPDKVVGAIGSQVDGWTYKQVLVDMVDYMAWNQADPGCGGHRGGWHYGGDACSSDNSNGGYAVLGLAYAESHPFNCTIPQFVKDELSLYVDWIQCDSGGNDDGGSGYNSPCYHVNILKTGNLVFQMTFVGRTFEDPNLQRALAYLSRWWNHASTDPGWKGPPPHYQSMYCVMRGLTYAGIKTIDVNGTPVNWYDEFAEAIVSNQQPDGRWPEDVYGGATLATEWALLTLEKVVPPEVLLTKVDVNEPNCVGPGDYITYTIDYNNVSRTAINDVNIIDYLPKEVDFNSASDGGAYDSNSHTVTWGIGTLSPGDSNCVTLTVEVKPCVPPCITIINECELTSGERVLDIADENTPTRCPILSKVDNIPDSSGVVPDANITYHLCYDANGYGDTNVAITDSLPCSLEFISAGPNAYYDSNTHTVTWHIGTLEPDASGCVTLTVKVGQCVESCGMITNCCEMTGDCIYNVTACENTPSHLVVDDFDLYESRDDLRAVWKDGYSTYENGSNITLSTEIDPRYPFGHTPPGPIYEGNNALQFVYNNVGYTCLYIPNESEECYSCNYCYSEIEANIVDLNCFSNWELEGIKSLSVWFYGDPDNDIGPYEHMYFAVEDGNGNFAKVDYPDMNDVKIDEWQEWLIDLREFKDANANLDLNDVNKVYIGFGERYNNHTPGGYGIVYFDSIRLCPPRCRLTFDKTASFNGGCVEPTKEIIYTIEYNNFSALARINVNIVDFLPDEVDFILASDGGQYHEETHTVSWDIGTLGSNDSNCITLIVKVNEKAMPDSIITNCCKMTGVCIDITACEHTPCYLVIDDFELYKRRNDLRAVWKDGYGAFTNGSNITLSTVIDPRYPAGHIAPGPIYEGSDALQFVYDNDKSIRIYVPGFEPYEYFVAYYYSEMEANIVDLQCTSNWELECIKMLSLQFSGDPDNDISTYEQMYMAVEDGDGDVALVKYGDSNGEDVNNLLSREWTEWAIDLNEFKDANTSFDLNDVNKVYIGFGERYNYTTAGGSGVVYFDNIRLYRQRCVPAMAPVSDLTDDCIIDFYDFALLADSWHGEPPNAVPIIDLNASDFNSLDKSWPNMDGTLDGQFDVNLADFNDNPTTGAIDGLPVVTFDGNDYLIADFNDFNAPGGITGANDFTIVMIVFNPAIADEEHIFAWSRRGEPNGTNAAVGYGFSPTSGAVVHWGEPDMGFDSGVPAADMWHQIAITYDGLTEKVLVDGKLKAVEGGKILDIYANDPVVVGASYYWDPNDPNNFVDTTLHYSGSVNRIRVYDEGLPQHQLEYMATGKFYADLNGDGKVNFKDLAIMVDDWLKEKLFP